MSFSTAVSLEPAANPTMNNWPTRCGVDIRDTTTAGLATPA